MRVMECAQHGSQPATFVCQHLQASLLSGRVVGFFTSDDPNNPRPDAWCGACERAVQRTGGEWTDESEGFAGVRLMCGACYDHVRALNAPGTVD
jgi:hypothetical protein